ncbi:MAG TPA: ornithine carbamoyltransferase [Solirubrobacteraceae bacterium]|nr:ornithine carbamoyltransferase [Solirubrobacteraceae bacterium]
MAALTHTRSFTDLLTIDALSIEEFETLLELSAEAKRAPLAWRDQHAGQVIACHLGKPSIRTAVSLEAAAHRLGALPVMLRPGELQLGRGETIADTARVLSAFVSAIAIRTFAQTDVEELAAAAEVPVINLLTNLHHPGQALADLLTLHEHFGELTGLKLAYVGDGTNVAHSLMEAGALAGMQVSLATPHGYEPDIGITVSAHDRARLRGGSVTVVRDAASAVGDAHAVYTDVWVSTEEDTERAERLQRLAPYRVDQELMSHARPDAVFMHCLPAHRGEEVAAEVIDGPQSIVFEQAANRLPTEQAVLHALLR